MEGSVSYVVPVFPAMSETFVAGEVTRLTKRGVSVQVLALSGPEAGDETMLAELRASGLEPVYVLTGYPGSAVRHVWRCFSRWPLRSVRAGLESARMPIVEEASKASRWLKALVVASLASKNGSRLLHGHWTLPTDVAILSSRILGVPYSFSAHAHDIYEDGGAYDAAGDDYGLGSRIAGAAFVATCTENNKRFLARLAPQSRGKIRLVYHGVDLDLFDGRSLANGDGAPLVLGVGRLVAYKGFDRLVEALIEIARNHGSPFRCVLIGDGSQRTVLERSVEMADLSSRIRFLGAQPQREVRDWLRRADLFVLAGDHAKGQYGLPNVLFEAMAMSVATISTHLPGIEELISNGEDGLVLDDPEELRPAIEHLLGDPILRRRLGRSGRKTIADRFDAEKTIVPLERLVRHAATGDR